MNFTAFLRWSLRGLRIKKVHANKIWHPKLLVNSANYTARKEVLEAREIKATSHLNAREIKMIFAWK